jgi:putative flippase GtrA
MPCRQAIERFFKYLSIGASVSALDIYLLWILTTHFGVYYIFSAGVTFLIGATLGYLADRHFVFAGTTRDLKTGYLYFLAITGAGLLMTLLTMAVLVEIFSFHYIVARILVAGGIGVWNYLMNLYVNFKVAGKY